MTLYLILLITTAVFILLQFVHRTLQKVMGYKSWYRNIYLRTWHWRFTRKVKFFFSGRKCKACGRSRGVMIDVHHRDYSHKWWEWLYLNDLEVLCRYHHTKEHGR